MFPRPDTPAIAVLYGNDAYGLSSTFRDVKNLAQICHDRYHFSAIYAVTDSPLALNVPVTSVIDPDLPRAVSKILASHPSDDLFLVLSCDVGVGAVFSGPLHDLLLSSHKRAWLLVDMCECGAFLNLPHRSSAVGTEIPESARVITVNAVQQNQFDADTISDMGFDGGLIADFIDFVTEHPAPAIDLQAFFAFRQGRAAGYEPPVMSELTWGP